MQNIEQTISCRDVPISALCDVKLWNHFSPLTALYMPFGFLLLLFRLLLIGAYGVIFPLFPVSRRKRIYRIFIRMLGIRVRCNMTSQEVGQHTAGCVVASTHVSIFDHIPGLAMPHATLMIDKSDSPLGKFVGYILFKGSDSNYWLVRNQRQLVQCFRQWNKSPEQHALYITPEATINNGKALFRFRPEFMIRGQPVVPLALKVKLPFGLSPSPMMSPGYVRFLTILMMPYIHFEVTYLDKLHYSKEQAPQEFADTVQQAIADYLEIPATRWTKDDKYSYREQLKQS
ncbi:lysophospholipid acyltransferase family protein [Vibrio mangrovi]|uniref:2-acyl-glycerophospho-ethanolamine acyltransferase n=1 Tax=Vibrio mangrovi TaxID=474394 RepID=A0A1Y6IR95_9VIBR|nr:hypothetical protein [Vibrio mangrovi]MDW6003886.1 hypothetical protein [Vibrio mangrovi]SMR99320.1 hypothetical protein VIM7927_00545 [Vibrio mangrovi]